MSDQQPILPAVISTFSRYAWGGNAASVIPGAGSAGTWPTNNLGLFVPLWLPAPFRVKTMFWANGGAVSGNVDVGVYAPDGTLIVSKGSTAQATINVIQIVTPTETLLPPGHYYLAMAASSTGGQYWRNASSIGHQQFAGVLQAASQVPLATAPTFASPANAYMPLFGIASITTY